MCEVTNRPEEPKTHVVRTDEVWLCRFRDLFLEAWEFIAGCQRQTRRKNDRRYGAALVKGGNEAGYSLRRRTKDRQIGSLGCVGSPGTARHSGHCLVLGIDRHDGTRKAAGERVMHYPPAHTVRPS